MKDTSKLNYNKQEVKERKMKIMKEKKKGKKKQQKFEYKKKYMKNEDAVLNEERC